MLYLKAGVDKNRVLSNSESNTILHYSFIYLFVIYMIRSSLIRVFMRRVYHFKYPFHASRTKPVLPTQARIAMECDPPYLPPRPASALNAPRQPTAPQPRDLPACHQSPLAFAASNTGAPPVDAGGAPICGCFGCEGEGGEWSPKPSTR